jgi:translation elongation factor EF-1beta
LIVTLCFAAKLVPLAYGIHKLQISCVVEDDKVSVDWLQETLEGIDDYVSTVYSDMEVMNSSLVMN